MVTLHSPPRFRWRPGRWFWFALPLATGALRRPLAIASDTAAPARPLEPEVRARVMLAYLAVVVMCTVLWLVVWYASGRLRLLLNRDSKRSRPSGRVGPSDWDSQTLAPVGPGDGRPGSSETIVDDQDSSSGDTQAGDAPADV